MHHTMRAIRLHEFGAPDNLRYETIPEPHPDAGQVQIAVEAAGVHRIDTTLRAGIGGAPLPLPELPMTPGREIAGLVRALGPDVASDWIGKRVVCHLGTASGGYADYAIAPVASLHVIPTALDAATAVAAIGTGRTAMAILEAAEISNQDVVIVTAAAGGLGSLLVQAAKHAGALVIGLAGGREKVERVRDLAADVAVDYRRPGWPDEVRRELHGRAATVVLDGVGGDEGKAAFDLLGVAGRMIVFGWSSGKVVDISVMDLFGRGLTITVPIGQRVTQRPGGIRSLESAALKAATAGWMLPVVGQRFALSKAADAHRAVESRRTIGKTVLIPDAILSSEKHPA